MEAKKLFESAQKMCKAIEENFVSLGEMLTQIKDEKIYRFVGYETFKDFVETELHISGSRANTLANIYKVFIQGMDMYDGDIQAIGYDKVALIVPMVRKAESAAVAKDWVEKADGLNIKDLRSAIKVAKEEKGRDFKKVYAEQATERLCEYLSCNKKMLVYNLAFYFQNIDMDEVASIVYEKRKAFEAEILGVEMD
jgi:hypothetical protein